MQTGRRPRETSGRVADDATLTSYRRASYTFIWGTEKHSLLLLEPKLLRCVRGDRYAPYTFDYLVTSESGRTRAYSTPGMQAALLEYGRHYLEPDFVRRLQADYEAFGTSFRAFLTGLQAQDWSGQSNDELDEFYEKYFWYLVDTYTFFALTFGWKLEATNEALREALHASPAMRARDVAQIASVVTSPAGSNEVSRERLAWLRLLANRDRSGRLEKSAILSHVRTFPWLAFNTYDEDEILSFFHAKVAHYVASGADADDDIARLLDRQRALDDEQRHILESVGSERVRYLSGVLRWASEERLNLKWFWAGCEYLAFRPLKEIASRIGIPFHRFIHAYKRADIGTFLRAGTSLPDSECDRRVSRVTYLVTEGKLFFAAGQDATRLEADLVDKTAGAETLLRGSPAYPGRVTGPVKIIKVDDLHALERDFARFRRGDVLVTTMTQPNIVMLIERAGAVLTDEGGITSHAAVLCRELRIPCIIGLHRATVDLAEGDVVDVNASEGTVTVLDPEEVLRAPVRDRDTTDGPSTVQVGKQAARVPRPESVLWLADVGRDDVASVGGKAANLGELCGRFPVPSAFSVTTSGYRAFLEEACLAGPIADILDQRDLTNWHEVECVARQIRSLILAGEVPSALRVEIEDAYLRLRARRVAVRSSATAEDSPTASFAGQFDSVLNVTGAEGVIQAVIRCWASLYTARAIWYRGRTHTPQTLPMMSVLVQEMVDAEYAGVIFTVHPVDHRNLLIEAVEGTGEALVSGRRTPNRYVLADDLAILERSESFDLSDQLIDELARFGQAVAAALGEPADIEFALADDLLYLLQARPITTLMERT